MERRSAPRDPRLSEVRTKEQLAEALGIEEESVTAGVRRGGIPEPDYRLGSGLRTKPLWHRRTVERLTREWEERRAEREES